MPRIDTLDPSDWDELRAQGHRMLDDMFDYLEHIRARPVWQPIPEHVRERFREPLPREGSDLNSMHAEFLRSILPYAVGNAHPRFMAYVHGGGTAIGMLADMLAAGLNANVGGRDQIPVEVEWQVLRWVTELFRFPNTAGGLFVTGSSMANLIALLVARVRALGPATRRLGLCAEGLRLTAYTSSAAHRCIAQAMEVVGLGSENLRRIPIDAHHEMDVAALGESIARDRAQGRTPFFVAATAGTVDTGAIDPLTRIAELCAAEDLWFHVDGAFGAMALLSPDLAPRLEGIERADSVAFDFHKWVQVPYDAGFILVRDGALHRATFAAPAAYLSRDTRGLAAGSPWPCDFGLDLSRGFRALKTWFTLKAYGTERLGRVVAGTCDLARYLAARVASSPALELLAPVSLNIVCFRHRAADADADALNAAIVGDLQESGVAAPSTTTLSGKLAIRAAIFNHRTRKQDLDEFLRAVLAHGERHLALTAERY